MLSSHWRYSRCLGRYVRMQANIRHSNRRQSTSTAQSSHQEISAGLLQKARNVAAEHSRLTKVNAESYDLTVAKRIGELSSVTTALKEYEDIQKSLKELNAILEDPQADSELRDLASADAESTLDTLPQASNNLKASLIAPHPFATFACMVEIRPGAGGSESSIFANDLLAMYTSLCQRLSLPTVLAELDSDASTPAGSTGITSCLLEINASNAYDLLRTEAGVHRVQRVPATEKKGRTHTSAVSVLVMPKLPDTTDSETDLNYTDPGSDYYIDPNDVKMETLRSSGAGGQHVNKTESAVRLSHIPTGIVVKSQEGRSQHKNREKAFSILRSKIAQMRREERETEIANMRRSVMGGVGKTGREDKIRTYNFSQNRVTDHRSGKESNNLDDVLGGGEALERVMDSVRAWMQEGEILGLLADDTINDGKT